jgi:uncharacterized membrane protein YsdA (DUF1294 family)
MPDPNAIIATGTILLGLIGGIAGNFFVYNIFHRKNPFTIFSSLVLIFMIIIPFLGY